MIWCDVESLDACYSLTGPFRVGYGDEWVIYERAVDAINAHVLRGMNIGSSWLQVAVKESS